MRSDFLLCAMFGMASASAILPRENNAVKPEAVKALKAKYAAPAKEKGFSTEPYSRTSGKAWRPKTSHPEFFSLRVDEACAEGDDPVNDCPFDNYAIRLEQGIVIATPYNRFFDNRLPIFFVDDDTELYTVSLILPD